MLTPAIAVVVLLLSDPTACARCDPGSIPMCGANLMVQNNRPTSVSDDSLLLLLLPCMGLLMPLTRWTSHKTLVCPNSTRDEPRAGPRTDVSKTTCLNASCWRPSLRRSWDDGSATEFACPSSLDVSVAAPDGSTSGT